MKTTKPSGAQDQERSPQQLASDLRFQELVFSASEDLLFVKDSEFRIVQANPAFLSVYPEEMRDEIIGTTTLEAYRPEEREEFLAEDRRALDTGFSEVQESIDFPDGRRRTLWTKKIGFHDEHGQQFVLGIGRDITALKESEDALRKSNSELEEFAYRVSHDLRSPLVSARQLIKMSQEAIHGEAPDVADNYLEAAASSLEKLDQLADGILNLSRVRLGEHRSEEIDLPHLAEDIWSHLTAHAADAPMFETDFALHSPLVADPDTLNLVLENLLSNAFKYRRPDDPASKVCVRAESDSERLTLEVSDNGIGFPKEGRDRIFQMFQRFHPGQSPGSGLGLYMIQKCAERLSGRFDVTHLTPGTKFTFQIPLELPNR